MKHFDEVDFHYEVRARKDFYLWVIIAAYVFFTAAVVAQNPLQSLYPDHKIAAGFIIFIYAFWHLMTFYALAMMLCDRTRGSRIDQETGDFVWWQYLNKQHGRIHPSKISLIEINHGSENSTIRIYDNEGQLLPYLDANVIPWPFDDWAELVGKRWPYIDIQIK